MEIVLSGLDQASCMEAFGALDCGGEAEWWPSSRLLEEVQRKSTDFNVIWFYGSPAWITASAHHAGTTARVPAASLNTRAWVSWSEANS